MLTAEKSFAYLLTGGFLAMSASGVLAQQPGRPPAPRTAPTQHVVQAPPAPAPAPSAEAPQRTTATYADWIVQCETQAGPPPQKVCDMAQVTQVQGKNLPFSRIAVAHPTKGQPVKLVVQVPVNVAFATKVRLQTGDADPGLTAPFARCVPAGCFADFEIKDDVFRKIRTASGAGKLSFADAAGHDVAVPLSFNGFGQAFDALAKE